MKRTNVITANELGRWPPLVHHAVHGASLRSSEAWSRRLGVTRATPLSLLNSTDGFIPQNFAAYGLRLTA